MLRAGPARRLCRYAVFSIRDRECLLTLVFCLVDLSGLCVECGSITKAGDVKLDMGVNILELDENGSLELELEFKLDIPHSDLVLELDLVTQLELLDLELEMDLKFDRPHSDLGVALDLGVELELLELELELLELELELELGWKVGDSSR